MTIGVAAMSKAMPFLLAALMLSACGDAGNVGGSVIRGSGKLQTETRQVAQFTAIQLFVAGNAVIERSDAESLTVTADDNVLPLLTSEVRNGTLILSVEKGKSFQGTNPTYKISVRDLRMLDVAGSGTLKASRLDSDALAISVSGSGTITVEGKAGNLDASVAGSGTVDAARLVAKRAKATVSGSGTLTVNATDELEARVSGSGSIRYLGSPKVTSNIAGSGSIRKQ
jgi:hypothetical protein